MQEPVFADTACPNLGLASDPRTHFDFPHPRHRCHVTSSLAGFIDATQQAEVCLKPSYASCVRLEARRGTEADEVAAQPEASPSSAAVTATEPAVEAVPALEEAHPAPTNRRRRTRVAAKESGVLNVAAPSVPPRRGRKRPSEPPKAD